MDVAWDIHLRCCILYANLDGRAYEEGIKEAAYVLTMLLSDEYGLHAAHNTPDLVRNILRCYQSRSAEVRGMTMQILSVMCWMVEGAREVSGRRKNKRRALTVLFNC